MAEDAEDELEAEDREEGEEDGEESGEKKKGGLKKLILFVGLPVVILALAGTAGALFLLGGGEETEVASAGDGHAGDEEEAAGAQSDIPPYTFDGPLLTNIVTGDGRTAMLSMEVAIVVEDESLYDTLDAHMEAVLDQYTGFLRELRPEDLEGSAGWHRLKLELLRRTNLAIAPEEVDDVLITNLAVQQ
ncbi:flagellar basal body-associated protein FliL [Marinicauda salina]|uniref:Flagellar protein FliL n=1 Tax=Marinicauda salina TaxID=2135793 RepID=A0A2U2BU50_9PROT|nr:flagellar basal body-associated FliL family protein [Marinicauda salina]PWE17551.1 flagellar basal body-associated protein FliL [Marinicauda salina]